MERKRGGWLKLSMLHGVTGLALLVAGVDAQAAEPVLPPVPQATEPVLPPVRQCTVLHDIYWEYVGDWVFYAAGERTSVELGFYRCQQGRLEEGRHMLEAVLRRNLVPFPRALPADDPQNAQAEGR